MNKLDTTGGSGKKPSRPRKQRVQMPWGTAQAGRGGGGGEAELRGHVTLSGAGPGRAACDAAVAAELGINGKSFGRSLRSLRNLRDGCGGARGGRDRSVRVGRSGEASSGGKQRR